MKNPRYIFILFIALTLFSCKETTPTFTVGVSQCSDDEWRQKMNIEMQHEAMLHSDIRLEIKTVTDDTEKQIADIQSFIDQKVDLLIVAPNKAAPVTPIVEKAFEAGIPMILVDRKILSDKYTAFIGADNFQIGKDVGNYIIKLLNGKGNIFEIRGLEGSSPATERHQGFISSIKNYPEINLLSSVDGAWLKDLAENKMDDALRDFPKIDVVYAHNDRMAMGAYNSALRHNRTDKIQFIGIDAIPGKDGGIEQVLDNKLKATFIYPTNGEKIIQLAVNILNGKPYEKNNTLYTNVVDESNARVLKLQSDAIIEQENKISFLNGKVDTYLSQYAAQRAVTWSAVAIVLLFSVSFVLIFRAYRTKNKLNQKLEKRNIEINKQKKITEQQNEQLVELQKQLEEAMQAKLVFFTNISHEFRTPLTLISGPVNSLLSDKTISQENRRLLSLAKKNVKILLDLIEQIIDFRKVENGKMLLNLSTNNLHIQLEEMNESFREMSKQRNRKFDFSSDGGDYQMCYDTKKMEWIYFNLLSNAFKFTPEKGVISVNLNKTKDENGEFAVLQVANTGKEISENGIQHIFERFYQVGSHHVGSGIGLALTKALVELHGGEISVESNETATTFSVRIPFIFKELKEQNEEFSAEHLEYADAEQREDYIFENQFDKNKNLLLVIDDNPDIRTLIKIGLQQKYAIIEAKDGAEGFRKAVKYVPDLIISDVMMPSPNGVELCQKLKNELSTSHIPVILLTAYSRDEQRIVGYDSGADDFVAKPFNADVLEARIKNLLENRRQLKAAFQQNLLTTESCKTVNSADTSFIEKLTQLIENNIANEELNIEDLGAEMGLSRTQLYRKVKSITDYSPVELLKIIRLKKAYHILSTTEMNISEVAYETGFTSPSYFAKCFREHYLETPTEYLKRIR